MTASPISCRKVEEIDNRHVVITVPSAAPTPTLALSPDPIRAHTATASGREGASAPIRGFPLAATDAPTHTPSRRPAPTKIMARPCRPISHSYDSSTYSGPASHAPDTHAVLAPSERSLISSSEATSMRNTGSSTSESVDMTGYIATSN
uniref:Uncharacterized protein n=1 Tax=Leersia perrieri TaxID=77586 RepID=A0A0D9VKA3_9ORYZ